MAQWFQQGTQNLPPEEGRITERHEDVAPAGVADEGSAGPCAAANGISGADIAPWPLHSPPGARAGESGHSVRCVLKSTRSWQRYTTHKSERLISIYIVLSPTR